MKNKILLIIIILLTLGSYIFTLNNQFLYKDMVIEITDIENEFIETRMNSLNLKEDYYIQKITSVIKNGDNKGETYYIENEYASSYVYSEKYELGDELIIENDSIKNLKRDTYIVLLIDIFILGIFLIASFTGLKTILTVIINFTIFYTSLNLYFKGFNLLFLTIMEIVLFTIVSLFITSGNNKKAYSAILSTLVSITILLLITFLIGKGTDYSGISFNNMSFVTIPIKDVFLAELIIGGLGAIMDIAITMSSSVSELIKKDKNIKKEELKKSCNEIGNDVMGTMINVIFFTYLSSGLPLFILSIRNGVTISNYINTNFSIEITRFLVASIGIVLTIPISKFISIKLEKVGDKYE